MAMAKKKTINLTVPESLLAQFDVVAINAITDPWLVDRLARVGQWEGLRLTPKPETPHAKDYRSIEIAYDATTLLPIGVFAVELKGERKTVFLNDTKRNQPVDEARLRVKPPIDPGWQVDIQNWRDPRPRRNPPAAPDQD